MNDGSHLAAVDLGSNSFHLLIARVEHNEIRPVEALAEKVQLGSGLRKGKLSEAAIERGLACLGRFAQVLNSFELQRMRVVGTNTLRVAKNRREFTVPASELLGCQIDVIYGREEARLVYLGVAHSLADDERSRLVIDIGGGSTELIVGERFEPKYMESLQMGCVSYHERYFRDDRINTSNYRAAYDNARLEISQLKKHFRAGRWIECVGSSGTFRAIENVLLVNGWSEIGITRKGLSRLEKKLLKFKSPEAISLQGLSTQRRSVITSGTAITCALFDVLGIERMRTSGGALREGVIYDLMGRLSHEDVRDRTVQALMQRYAVDTDTAEIVERRVRLLFEAAKEPWNLSGADRELLIWAARTLDIGMAISHKHYNRHSGYLLRNADLPGFSQEEQAELAVLAEGHRRKLKDNLFDDIAESDRLRITRLLCLIRLAVLFKYVEQIEQIPDFTIQAKDSTLQLDFPESWIEQHPLTASELEHERITLGKVGIRLELH